MIMCCEPAGGRWACIWTGGGQISRAPGRGAANAIRSGAPRGRGVDENAITLPVAASVCHQDTGYEALLMSGLPRDAARHQVQEIHRY
jgi:hypothetical protein